MDGQAFLRETTALIASGWCCGAEARNGLGVAVEPFDRSANAWSLRGALALVCERSDAAHGALRDALWGISGVIDDWSLDGWNDAAGRTQDDTLQMLAHAQVSLEENPPPDVGWSLDAYRDRRPAETSSDEPAHVSAPRGVRPG